MAIPSAPTVAGRPQEADQHAPATPERRSGFIAGAVKSTVSSAIHLAQYALGESENAQSDGDKSSKFVDALRSGLEQINQHTLARDAKTVFEGILQAGDPVDDRKLLLEKGIEMMSTLPPTSPVGPLLSNFFIGRLWADLPKPPLTYVGALKYRKADGSENNPFFPKLGAAGQPFARSVPAVHAMPDHLPDPDLVFDTLLKRDKFLEHPSGISSLLFNFATLIVHSVFKTNPIERTINDASSYLDLSPIYGDNEKEQQKVRTGVNGEIYPDAVASQRLFLMPPATIALALIFSRNHNYIVRKLLAVNQNDRFSKDWDSMSEEEKRKQDEDLLQTARLVNCGAFQNVIFQDYIRVILHVNETDSLWSLVPTGEIKQRFEGVLPRGTGQAVSAEFDLLYRWHSTISEKDAKWIEDIMRPHLKGKSFDDMTADDFLPMVRGVMGAMDDRGPRYWEFGGHKRTGEEGNGPFRDKDIVRTLTEATDAIAGAFKARGTPAAMKVIDVMGLAIARNEWNVASLNEFRRFLGLTEYRSFEEWAGKGNEDIAETARRLYKHIDNLELMPGLQCEETKPSMAGSGLCPGYTISRAILSDAAALVRGDRYLTTDYTAGNLTSAQFKDLQPDFDNGAFGGHIGKLILRHFPEHYTFNSTYALFPFTTPHTTVEILRNLKINEQYDASRPAAPVKWTTVHSYAGAKTVLEDEQAFENIYGAHIRALQDKYPEPAFMSSFTAFSDPKKRARSQDLIDRAVFPPHWASHLLASVGEKTKQKIHEMAWNTDKRDGKEKLRLDLVTDLVVPVAMDKIARLFGLPMKTKESPLGLFTHQTLYEMLSDCYQFVYQNFDPTIGYRLRESAKKHADVLRSVLEFRLGAVAGTPPGLHTLAKGVYEAMTGKDVKGGGLVLAADARKLYERVLEGNNRPIEETAGILVTAMVSMVTAVPATVNICDVLLEPEHKKSLDTLCKVTQQNVGMTNESTIARTIEEALRLQPAISGCARRSKVARNLDDGEHKRNLEQGQLIFINIKDANRDPDVFETADKIVLDRDAEVYKLNDKVQGLTNQKGESFSTTFAMAMLRELCQHPNLARAPGKAGQLGRIEGVLDTNVYLREDQRPAAFPCSMEITFSPVKRSA